jgi:hypothetical protein
MLAAPDGSVTAAGRRPPHRSRWQAPAAPVYIYTYIHGYIGASPSCRRPGPGRLARPCSPRVYALSYATRWGTRSPRMAAHAGARFIRVAVRARGIRAACSRTARDTLPILAPPPHCAPPPSPATHRSSAAPPIRVEPPVRVGASSCARPIRVSPASIHDASPPLASPASLALLPLAR